MFNGKRLDGIRGVLFDCYKTLIDIRTDESSTETPEETLYIGDSYENDINPSLNLGMKAMHMNDARKFFNVG